jgi:ABC-type taurine transport system ATPase subunit
LANERERYCMAILRMREACFTARGAPVGPVTVDVAPGERAARVFPSGRDAAIVALMAAGVVKAGSGSVLIGEFDPRVQSVHCKRIAGYVPHAPSRVAESEFERYIAYRAALWNVDPRRAVAHAKLLMERLSGMHEAIAYSIAGALIASPGLLVLDRPQPAYAQQIFAAAGPRAIFSTHVTASAARAFCAAAAELLPVMQ